MSLKNIKKQETLKINAYEAKERTNITASFEAPVMDKFSQHYGIKYQKGDGIGSTGDSQVSAQNSPTKMHFNIILDDTGILKYPSQGKSVSDQVDQFLATCYDYNGNIHQSNFLKLEWGELKFNCKLLNADVKYTHVDEAGYPKRVEIEASFIGDISEEDAQRKKGALSPDITHMHIFKAGDTLPLIAKKIYGSSSFYLLLARFNDINHFRGIKPGAVIELPPIQELEKYR